MSASGFISRHALLFKVFSQPFNGELSQLLRSLFPNAISHVKWNSELELCHNTHGELHGGVISLRLLYKLYSYISYASKTCRSILWLIGETRVNHLLQADDLLAMSETGRSFQLLLDRLELFCRRWHLILNVVKNQIDDFEPEIRGCERGWKLYFWEQMLWPGQILQIHWNDVIQ